MFDLMFHWSEWIKPSAGLPVVQWALLLAVAAATGHGLQRRWGLPQVLGYSLIGALAGYSGYTTASWPLDGIAQFLIELGLSIVLFEAGGRLSLRWLRMNPMLLVQSIVETLVTYVAALWMLRLFQIEAALHHPLALLITTTSPALLMRVAHDLRASGPVTDRAITLATLNTFYVLALGGVMARLVGPMEGRLEGPGMGSWWGAIPAVLLLVFTSVLVSAVLALALRKALAWMSPSSENTAVLQLALIAAGTALAAHFGGSAPLAALLAGVLIKAWNPRPWIWPRQFGTAASALSILTFVLVAMTAAQAPWQWQWQIGGLVLALALTRGVARIGALSATTLLGLGSGANLRQTFWTANTLWPMSAVALLLISQFAEFTPTLGAAVASIALPLLLLLELLGALLMTWSLKQTGEANESGTERLGSSRLGAPARTAEDGATPSTQEPEDTRHGT